MKTKTVLRATRAVFTVLAISLSVAPAAQAQTVDFIARFSGSQGSATGVLQATDGNFYGAGGGGVNGMGQIFRLTPTGQITTIYSFCSLPNCADGEGPGPVPILGADGNLYGVTNTGGATPTLYRVTLGGKLTTVYTFCATLCDDGFYPHGVIQGSDGNFYGTAELGGSGGGGTIFKITPAGQFTLLYTFCSRTKCRDGQNPFFPPIQGHNGNLYGTTYSGGARGGGVVYELTPSGKYTVLHNFCGQNESCEADPSTIVEDARGNLIGTTVYGLQVVFAITPSGSYRILHEFHGTDNGFDPLSGVTLANDGNFYGSNVSYGAANGGTLFEITPASEFTLLYTFASPLGYDPVGPLLQATDGRLYGATLYSGDPCCYGTVFRLDNGLSPLVKTVPVAGKVGQKVIILGNGLTGTTSVTFNGVPANFTVESSTYIKATVPAGAKTGTVSVVTPSGTLNSSPQFVVTK